MATGNQRGKAEVSVLIERLKDMNPEVSGPAWQTAGSYGAAALEALGALMSHPNFETARNAKRALVQIVRHAGRPGARKEARAVQDELIKLLRTPGKVVRTEALWMLSEIGDAAAAAPMALLLMDPETREDARCALLRLPRQQAVTQLRLALPKAPEDFHGALRYSLESLGDEAKGHPNKTRAGTIPTSVNEITK